jgi:hypothetical protein
MNVILYYILSNRQLGSDLNFLNQKLDQSVFFLGILKNSLQNFIDTFENINFILLHNCIPNYDFGASLENLKNYNKNDLAKKELSISYSNKFSLENFNDLGDNYLKKETFLSTKRKRSDLEKKEANIANKALHYRPKRDYEIKRKRIIKPRIFKIEKIINKKIKLRNGSKKYIFKRIQYCWKSYFLKLILQVVPKRYDIIISKKFYQDHTKGFYLQLFKRLNTVKDLIADVICLNKRHKEYKSKALNLKNMGQFIKEIQITPKIKAFNYKLLKKLKIKNFNQTIQMNMVKYFRSKNYMKRIKIYNCKHYDEVDLIKFNKPIKFFYSFVFKNFKFSIGDQEARRSIFYTDRLLNKRKNFNKE